MHKNRFWLAFLVFFTLVVLGYSGYTAAKIYHYSILDQEVSPKKVEWFIDHQSSDRFFIRGQYSFTLKDKTFEGETTFQKPVLVNKFAAEKALEDFGGKSWTIWFTQKDPEVSTLDTAFPLKTSAYAITLWGILIYFIWLGFYVGKKSY